MAEDDDRRAANQQLYGRMLAAQNQRDRQGMIDCLADDVVFEAPYYRDTPLADSAEAMGRTFDRMCEKFATIDYRILRFIDALDPDLVIAEVAGNNAVAGTDRVYRNRYLFMVTVGDGKIARLLEYSNPLVYAGDVDGVGAARQ